MGRASVVRTAFLGVLLALVLPAIAAAQTRVNSIDVVGNQRVPASTVISLTEINPGDVLSDGEIDDALQRVLASGLFETASVTTTGAGLRIAVVERPTVNLINIEGNRRLSDEELLVLLETAPRRVFSPEVVEADARRLADFYADNARLAATVTPQIIRRSDNRVDLVPVLRLA